MIKCTRINICNTIRNFNFLNLIAGSIPICKTTFWGEGTLSNFTYRMSIKFRRNLYFVIVCGQRIVCSDILYQCSSVVNIYRIQKLSIL